MAAAFLRGAKSGGPPPVFLGVSDGAPLFAAPGENLCMWGMRPVSTVCRPGGTPLWGPCERVGWPLPGPIGAPFEGPFGGFIGSSPLGHPNSGDELYFGLRLLMWIGW